MINSIEELRQLANQENCDGICDETFPFYKCPECLAREILNNIFITLAGFNDNVKKGYVGISQKVPEGKNFCKHGFINCLVPGCENYQ